MLLLGWHIICYNIYIALALSEDLLITFILMGLKYGTGIEKGRG